MNTRKIPIWKKILLVVESLVIIIYLFMTVGYTWFKLDRNGFIAYMSQTSIVRGYIKSQAGDKFKESVQDTEFKQEKVHINENLDGHVQTHKNIALFGIDSREGEFADSANSDTIIIVSINNKTGQVKMASIFRDTMLKIEGKDGTVKYFKANSGFFRAGPEGAINMLNTNLDLNITDYVVVNFNGVSAIIDALGGVDVNISGEEKFYINGYLTETRKITGLDAPDIEELVDGPIHLSGLQATAFCRIRYVKFTDEDGTVYNNDMGRTARQRMIIRKLIEKSKAAGVTELMNVANTVFNYNTENEKVIGTSFEFDEILDMIPTLINFSLVDNTGFPFTYETPRINGLDMVVSSGLSYNVAKLHEFLFDDQNYRPSSTVQNISDYLESYTGIGTVKTKEDREKEKAEDQEQPMYSNNQE